MYIRAKRTRLFYSESFSTGVRACARVRKLPNGLFYFSHDHQFLMFALRALRLIFQVKYFKMTFFYYYLISEHPNFISPATPKNFTLEEFNSAGSGVYIIHNILHNKLITR